MSGYSIRPTTPQPKNTSRPADSLAGAGSVAGKLKQMRTKLEQGESVNPVVGEDQNTPDQVVQRGYFKEE